jgi:hypothetical protein
MTGKSERKNLWFLNISVCRPCLPTHCRSSSPGRADHKRSSNLGGENHQSCPANHGASVRRKRQHSYVDSVLLLLGSYRVF